MDGDAGEKPGQGRELVNPQSCFYLPQVRNHVTVNVYVRKVIVGC